MSTEDTKKVLDILDNHGSSDLARLLIRQIGFKMTDRNGDEIKPGMKFAYQTGSKFESVQNLILKNNGVLFIHDESDGNLGPAIDTWYNGTDSKIAEIINPQ